jgi:hypothetical protein
MKCVSKKDVILYLEGQLSPEKTAALKEHFAHCNSCASLHEQLVSITQYIAPDDDEFKMPQLAENVMTLVRLGQGRPEKVFSGSSFWSTIWLQRLWMPIAACLLVAIIIPLWLIVDREPRPIDSVEFVARGSTAEKLDSWVSIRVFRKTPSDYQLIRDGLTVDDVLAFAYDNRSGTSLDFLMIFAVDQSGRIFWYYPAFLDESENPKSIKIADTIRTPKMLPDEVQHGYQPGLLRMFAVFSSEALDVKRIEEIVARDLKDHRSLNTLKRLSIANTGQHSILMTVKGE